MITPVAFLVLRALSQKPADVYTVEWTKGTAEFKSPIGKPLWSFGVDCVDTGTSRKDYKESNKSYASFKLFTGDSEWAQDTVAKLTSWGFNSTGGWSDDETFKKYAGKNRLPYFVVLHLGAWNQAPWHDMFDKTMDHWVTVAAEKQIPQLANDPYLVGYFSDNELGWWDDTLFMSYLKMKHDTPGHKRLIQSLRDTYRDDFSMLQKDWLVKGSSFDTIDDMHLRGGSDGRRAVDAWTGVLGRRYYSLMRDTIRRYDKKHLILGDRYCQYYTLPIVRAATDYVDVVSTNFGADWNDGSIAPFFLRTLHGITGKPVIVTEFYMCATENRSGNKNSSTAFPVVKTQPERAAAFAKYVKSVASLPYTVGAHWFQFSDEPAKGRGDGENFNMGLVDTDGRPYEEMISACESLNLASLRAKASDSLPSNTVVVPKVAEVPHGTLKGWPRDRGVLPVSSGTPFGDLFVVQDAESVYIALYAMDYMDEGLYLGGHIPDIDRNRWQVRFAGFPPIEVRYGGKGRHAWVNQPGIAVQEVSGLKYTVILKIPRTLFRGAKSVLVSSTATTHSRSASMTWNADLDLEKAK